jgi:hypothetical protein
MMNQGPLDAAVAESAASALAPLHTGFHFEAWNSN